MFKVIRFHVMVNFILALRRGVDAILTQVFPACVGMVSLGGDVLTAYTVDRYAEKLWNMGDTPTDWVGLLKILEKRVDARGASNSKKLAKWAREAGISTDHRDYQHLLSSWLAEFQVIDLEYQVRWDPTSFDWLGHHLQVDLGRSCFADRGCNRDKPVALALAGDGAVPTFVVLLLKAGQVVARCIGWLDETTNLPVLSNGYYQDGLPRNGMFLFAAAVDKAAASRPHMWWEETFVKADCHLNGDVISATSAPAPLRLMRQEIAHIRTPEGDPEMRVSCAMCGRTTTMPVHDGALICPDCY